ncbi:Cytochrome bd-I ubiquinol oxidase subunit 1 [Ralstonia mannitolilytica]|uniref:cytochrome ubiquinol oxidase subunit I n=1 Tax=Ralstonia mannitolilytica TaxID=105219 RepID=UPI0028F64FB4|nr:cytochrome ubiquinol oxidase subunit I [Ralstonia mannitolilytica]CAJ0792058.1 Cytochrome bd-I ubiquinol oxidase subunit 1 [Ralstonia mannitolilytica]
MEIFDALHLARLQFAFTVSIHIIFPAISIGMASFLAVLEWRWLATGDQAYKDMFLFWSKIFAIGFGMGVVSGVVMAYEFGTNWSGFSQVAGNVTGPLLHYEVLTAFFLEAGFLGIVLFGWNRVSPRAHFFATLMVALGTLISTFWILASNSFMQTPQGFAIENGRIVPVDWLKVIFNPSFPYRLVHMTIAAFIVAGFMVAACGAWHLLRGRRDEPIKRSFSMALWLLLLLTPVQILIGDAHGLNTREYQPAKIAAIEGLWETEKGGTALNLFGLPDMQAETTRYAVQVPHLGSLILTHSWDGEIRGLKEFPPQDRPYSPIVFWSFRLMVGLGLLMLLTAVLGLVLRKRGRLYEARWFQRFVLYMGPSGLIALLAGWVTTEVGRQPWTVYGILRTEDSVAPVNAQLAGVSLLIFVIVYFAVFGTGVYYMLKLMYRGPSTHTDARTELHQHPELNNRALDALEGE